MDTDLDPVVGNWYRRTDKDQLFKVVAFDEDREIVEIQRFDGERDEIDASVWFDLEIEPADAPEDWDGPLDDADEDETQPKRTLRGKEWEDEDPDETDADEDDDEWDDEPPEDEDDDDWDGDEDFDDDDDDDADESDDSDDDR